MNIKRYFDIIDEIKKEASERKVKLSDGLTIALMQEAGKDLRSEEIEQSRKKGLNSGFGLSYGYNKQKSSPEALEMRKMAIPGNNKPTERQIETLKRLGVKNIDNLSKSDAFGIIQEAFAKNKKEEVY
jgi:hypothetical protein